MVRLVWEGGTALIIIGDVVLRYGGLADFETTLRPGILP